MELKKNDIVPVHIDGAASGGEGVAHVDGQAVFVKGALPGEECLAHILRSQRGVVWAKADSVTAASAHRIAPECPVFPRCGGCALLHADYEEELRIKRERVNDAFARIGGLDLRVDSVTGSDERFGYRNKAVFAVGRAGGRAVTGFYRARSHDILPVERCLLQTDAANAAAAVLREWMDATGAPEYDEQTHKGCMRRLMARTASDGSTAVCLVCAREPRGLDGLVEALRRGVPGLVSVTLDLNSSHGNAVLSGDQRLLWGAPRLTDTVLGLRFSLSPMSFFQINRRQAERLYSRAIEYASLDGCAHLLDLYCGTGTIGLCAARYVGRVTGAEVVPEAVEDARENARANGIENASFITGDAAEAARRLADAGERPDVIIVDPPRAGLEAGVIAEIVRMAPERVVYVSCDPATLARDLRVFAPDYTAVAASAFDMFPATSHVESVVKLVRERRHSMDLAPRPFSMIKNGKKTIELRLFDEKRQKIKVGDSIVFTETATGEKLSVKVEKLHRFDSFEELYRSLPLLECGYTEETVADARPSDMEGFYSPEKQKKYGVVGIEISLPDGDTD